MCASLGVYNFCTTGSPIYSFLDVSYVPCIHTDNTQFKGRAREHNSWCLMCVCVLPSNLFWTLVYTFRYTVCGRISRTYSTVHCCSYVLFFSFNDVRVIRHYSKTMLLFPYLDIVLFPSLDIVRTDVCATHYATPHVRHTTVQYYSVQIMLARSVPEVCLPETSSRDLGHCHSFSTYSSHTRCCAACVWSVTECTITLKRVEGNVSE